MEARWREKTKHRQLRNRLCVIKVWSFGKLVRLPTEDVKMLCSKNW